MAAAQVAEYLAGCACSPLGNVVQALPNGLVHVRPSRGVEQPLVGLGVLDNGLGLLSYGEDQGPFALSEASDELARIAPETRQRLDVFGDVKHGKYAFRNYV
jgi:hypothetical protein